MTLTGELRAPFVYFGGKSKVAAAIWERVGDVPNWVSPFAGSMAVELARPHAPKVETLGDLDCMIVNFYRAVQWAPELVARHTDWPSTEADLVARHNDLQRRREGLTALVMGDPRAFDAEAAGWWAWGASCSVGKDWYSVRQRSTMMPDVKATSGVHRRSLRGVAPPSTTAEGISFGTVEEWLQAIARRLRNATIVCGDWQRLMGPSICGYADSSGAMGMAPTGILLDPPYSTEGRDSSLYTHDSGTVAADVRAWCLEHGDDKRLRIALCGYAGEGHEALEAAGWSVLAWKAKGGYGGQRKTKGKDGSESNENAKRERVWFSPGCLAARQLDMFAAKAPGGADSHGAVARDPASQAMAAVSPGGAEGSTGGGR